MCKMNLRRGGQRGCTPATHALLKERLIIMSGTCRDVHRCLLQVFRRQVRSRGLQGRYVMTVTNSGTSVGSTAKVRPSFAALSCRGQPQYDPPQSQPTTVSHGGGNADRPSYDGRPVTTAPWTPAWEASILCGRLLGWPVAELLRQLAGRPPGPRHSLHDLARFWHDPSSRTLGWEVVGDY